ncbi:MAG: GNAT family N-acetyltransferase [Rhodobacteraceae bacterium]|nr:GNAT family N-acetyltransferase [Paracoccaceae bacterium]
MAALHARAFTNMRPWSAAEFGGLLQGAGVFWHGSSTGFILGRVTLDEAEILTLAVEPNARRAGLGRALLDQFETSAKAAGASRAFLEVAKDNAGACGLYRAAGYLQIGCRPGYYVHQTPAADSAVVSPLASAADSAATTGTSQRVDALILAKEAL